VKQAELLLGVFAGYVHGNATAQFKITFDGFGSAYELAKRIGYLALIELGPVSDFNAVEKHMEVNVFQVTLKLALGQKERPEFDAIGHGVMVAAGEKRKSLIPLR
jgi:hypothetical protein